MNIDVFTSTGEKKGTVTLPAALFEAPAKMSLLHQALVRQQSNRRSAIAHSKNRSEIQGSTRKLFKQKGTGRARRGPIRSPLLRGGNKAFGPRSNANFIKQLPKTMRRAALFGCLSLQAKKGTIIGLQDYPATIKTKQAFALLGKLPVEIGRPILVVAPEKQDGLMLSLRNVPRVKVILAAYLNPEDVLHARHIIFLVDAIKKAEEIFTKEKPKMPKEPKNPKSVKNETETKKVPARAKPVRSPSAKKSPQSPKSPASSGSSVSSDSSKK